MTIPPQVWQIILAIVVVILVIILFNQVVIPLLHLAT
jgi:hypothetical protein